MQGYILVYTTSSAFESEEILKKLENVKIKLVPTPREFSSDCGIAVWFECEDLEPLNKALNQNKIEYEIKIKPDE
ncbi:MAG: DUF3343 domain-containing protein [Helicobacter sp.]|nr:DUF3343 domain-containing protein [Helicobacter sp.]